MVIQEDVRSGKAVRKAVPRRSHAAWVPPSDRQSPVEIITSQNGDRLQWLIPIRHWRMARSPFTFYRGAAKLMAADLSGTPVTGINAQICGDAHLSNFGLYGSPERKLVFDLNDFDETLPGPWEWDVKRLAVSFAIAAAHNELDESQQSSLAVATTAAYRVTMAKLADMRYLEAWYSRIESQDLINAFKDEATKKERSSAEKTFRKARSKDSLHVLGKLAEESDDGYRIVSQPPLIVPLRDLADTADQVELNHAIDAAFEAYLDSVPDHMQVLLQRFRFSDVAVKVVGVGSVGTRCFIALLEGKDADDPLFIQVKEATR
ncbi:MAG: DUF2252 family protein, partial [Acidimicrobiia bacterium]